MVFASLEFLTLFLPLFLLVYGLAPASWRNAVLLGGSWIFYAWWSPAMLWLLVGLTVLGWVGAHRIAAAADLRRRKAWLALLIAANLGLLCWYKYANIVVDTMNALIAWRGAMPVEWERIGLPIGLSFIVLQSISYLIDVYRGTVAAQRSFVVYGAYQAMFVHLIAGPIIRYDWVQRELLQRVFDARTFSAGAHRFMIGLCMKVLVADTLAPVADLAFAQASPSLADAWLGCAAYTLQLFFDFAGYSAMAIGLGLILGFRIPENFNNPYQATSIQDFWRRWHLSLSTWLRDYLYIPLGGNRKGPLRTYVNLLLTMAIAGLWHGGDSWNYLFWGVLHGLALALGRLWGDWRLPALPRWLGHVSTLLFVMLAWVLFRSHDVAGALAMYRGQLGLNGIAPGDAMAVTLRASHVLAAALGVSWIVLVAWAARVPARTESPAWRMAAGALPVAGFLLSFGLLASRGAVPFLYFQF